jgi:hypothetical protein
MSSSTSNSPKTSFWTAMMSGVPAPTTLSSIQLTRLIKGAPVDSPPDDSSAPLISEGAWLPLQERATALGVAAWLEGDNVGGREVVCAHFNKSELRLESVARFVNFLDAVAAMASRD